MIERRMSYCGKGRGFGQGFRVRRFECINEKEALKQEAEVLEKELEQIKKRLGELN